MIDFTFPALVALVSSLVYVGGMIVVIWRRAYPMVSWALFEVSVLAFVEPGASWRCYVAPAFWRLSCSTVYSS
jgi:hypothetical protein